MGRRGRPGGRPCVCPPRLEEVGAAARLGVPEGVSANRHTGRAPSRGTWRSGPDGPRCAGARHRRWLGFSAALPELPRTWAARNGSAGAAGSEAGEPQPGSGGRRWDALPPPSARLPVSGHGKSAGQTGGPARAVRDAGPKEGTPAPPHSRRCPSGARSWGGLRSVLLGAPRPDTLDSQRVTKRVQLILSCLGEWHPLRGSRSS